MGFLFLSHSSKDDSIAEIISDLLAREGRQSIFLDHALRNGATGGEAWEERLYTELRRCRALIALVSPDWLESPWCAAEVSYAQALRKAIIPVQIADIDGAIAGERLPPALRPLQFIDWRKNDAPARLAAALLHAGLDPKGVSAWDGTRDPYPGLAAFRRADAPIYFGRDQNVTDLLAILNACRAPQRSRMVIVQGASGSGKSSLLGAGLLPRLEQYPERWLVLPPCRPLKDPLAELVALFEFASKGAPLPERPASGAWGAWLVKAAAALRKGRGQTDCTVLITIDQLEEALALPASMADEFLLALRDALDAADFRLLALATLRADFVSTLQRCRSFREPAPSNEILATQAYQLGPMPRSSFHSVILGPAEVADFRVEPALVTRLVDDAKTEDALPLLAFVLGKLWERQGRAKLELTLAEYGTMGGLENAVGAQAAQIFKDLQPTTQETEAFRTMLLFGMTDATSEGRILRKRFPWNSVPKEALRLTAAFIEARLFVAGKDEIEVAHEAIYHHWPVLVEWLKENADDLRARQRIVDAYGNWLGETKDRPSRLLPSGRPLEEGRELLKKPGVLTDSALVEYIEESIRAEETRQRERQRRKRWQVRAALALALIPIAVVFGLRAAAASESRRLGSLSLSAQDDDGELSILFASMAVARYWPWSHDVLPEVEQQLHRAVLASHVRFAVTGPKDSRMFVALNGDGTRLATGRADGSVWIHDAVTSQGLQTISGPGGGVQSVAWSPDSLRMAIGTDKGAVSVRDISSGKEVSLPGKRGAVLDLAWSKDGLLAIAQRDGAAEVWDAAAAKQTAQIGGSGNPHDDGNWDSISKIAWSPDGNRLAGVSGTKAQVWDVKTGKQLLNPPIQSDDDDDTLTGIAWSPDGLRLATSSDWDNSVKIWDGTGKLQVTLQDQDRVDGVAWSPDGSRLLTAGRDGIVWDAKTGALQYRLKGHAASLVSVAWARNGRMATGGSDGTARVWVSEPGNELTGVHGDSVVWSLDDKTLATAGASGTAQLWNAATGAKEREMQVPGHNRPLWSPNLRLLATPLGIYDAASQASLLNWTGDSRELEWGADSKRIARITGDKVAEIWNADSRRLLRTLEVGTDRLNGTAWSPDGKTLATIDWDGPQGEGHGNTTVELWDTATGKSLRQVGYDSQDALTTALWSPTGKSLATDNAGSVTIVWDATSGSDLARMYGPNQTVIPFAWSPDARRLATGGASGLRIWDVSSGNELVNLSGLGLSLCGFEKQPVPNTAAWSHDGKRLALAVSDGSVQVYAMDIALLMDLARSRVTAHPSPDGCTKYLRHPCPAFPSLSLW